jgi:hypothetical protein
MNTLKDRHDLLQELERLSRQNIVSHINATTPPKRRRDDDLNAARGILAGLALTAILIIPFIIAWAFGG